MFNKYKCLSFATLSLFGLALSFNLSAYAAIVSFDNFQLVGSDDVDYIVTIEDDAEAGVSADSFRITYEVAASSPNTVGKLTGFFLDFGDLNDAPVTFSETDLNIANEIADTLSCGQAVNADSINAGRGCNTQLQLGADAGAYQAHEFDIAIAWRFNDVSSFGASSFEISDLGFTVFDISAVALRGQDTSGDGGSSKDFSTDPTVVPVPGSIVMFLSSFLVFAAMRKRSNT